jgi:Flp pilus assembly protein TadG
MRTLQSIARLVKAGSRDIRGVATVELALVSTVMIGLMLPMFDIGMGFYFKTQLHTAAQAGAEYAYVHDWTGSNSTIQTSIVSAVTSATGLAAIAASPAPTLACGCVDGTTITLSTPSSPYTPDTCASQAACSGSNNPVKPGAFVTVNAQGTYTPLITYLGFGSPITLSATSVVRVQ